MFYLLWQNCNNKAAVKTYKYWTKEDCKFKRRVSGWWEAAAEYGLPVEAGCGERSLIKLQICIKPRASLQLEQFHVEYKCGVRWDDPGVACGSISHIWCAGDFGPLAQAHLCYSFLPALYDLSPTNLEFKRLVPVSRRVKLLPILQHTYVMNNTCLALLWKCSSCQKEEKETCVIVCLYTYYETSGLSFKLTITGLSLVKCPWQECHSLFVLADIWSQICICY